MRALTGAAAVTAALAMAGSAAADVKSAFDTMCLATEARDRGVEAAAVEGGWQPAPAEALAKLQKPGARTIGFVKTGTTSDAPKDTVLLTTLAQPQVKDGVSVEVAVCQAFGPAGPTLEKDLVARLGPGQRTPEGQLVWAFTKRGSQITPAPLVLTGTEADRAKLFAQGPVYVAGLAAAEGGTAGILLSVFRRPGS
ncbi:hypothetical protein [Caulobacter sp. 17J65-9]|uniref:hypothetical protein n=1 Tax=Caulobacter sp. 17J65-9 TaxID=2709382 RepID=UPI0013CD5CB0|nr:hypothetical protein [Caulobacter sp. 17J65-9]NEX94239.1 hypothetical protein [Caulobacter sp. 17J65-9]